MTRKTAAQLLREARAEVRRLEPREAAASDALLVDTRDNETRRAEGVIPGALHIPLNVLEWRVDPDSPTRNPHVGELEREVVVVCSDGYSSSLAAARLRVLGFTRATDLVGGFSAWKAAGLPVGEAQPPPEGRPGSGGPD